MAVRSRVKQTELDKKAAKLADNIADRTYGQNADKNEPKKRLGLDLPESTYEAFFLKARTQDKTDMSSLVRQWINNYLSD